MTSHRTPVFSSRCLKGGVLAALLVGLAGAGCAPQTRQNVLSLLFDGTLRPVVVTPAGDGPVAGVEGETDELDPGPGGSRHQPHAEKKCDACHDFTRDVGLVRKPRELCFLCHKDFVKGRYVHGPVSVGNCSACHLPHTAPYPFLLERDRTTICEKCHREGRLAPEMHGRVVDHEMSCVDCHDPHDADTPYLLR